MKKLLLFSNSTMVGLTYLEYTLPYIKKFLKEKNQNILFIPFAAVTFSYDNYEKKVNEALFNINLKVTSIHHMKNKKNAIKKADIIVVGGGNTWKLLKKVQDFELLGIIKEKVQNGTPYIGWSAGSNLACPTIKTTNDMPITQPKDFNALNLIPFQINPHFLDKNPKGHGGETREDRINEFLKMNKSTTVVGLREGTLLWIENNEIKVCGKGSCRIFSYGKDPIEKEELLNCLVENNK